jgi:co-chaperonin GroES (HSP10)
MIPNKGWIKIKPVVYEQIVVQEEVRLTDVGEVEAVGADVIGIEVGDKILVDNFFVRASSIDGDKLLFVPFLPEAILAIEKHA